MSRLIDADALKTKAIRCETFELYDMYDSPVFLKAVGTKEIDRAPTVDAVPVIRCKDCKHWHKDTVFCGYMPYGEASERVNWYADDFCSYGERKDGAN